MLWLSEGRTRVVALRRWRRLGHGLPFRPGDLLHGVVEGQTQDVHEKVDGVAGEVALWPPPIGVFDEESLEGRQLEVARVFFEELQSLLLQQGNQQDLPGRADLFAAPAGRWVRRGRGCHSLSSNEVERGRG